MRRHVMRRISRIYTRGDARLVCVPLLYVTNVVRTLILSEARIELVPLSPACKIDVWTADGSDSIAPSPSIFLTRSRRPVLRSCCRASFSRCRYCTLTTDGRVTRFMGNDMWLTPLTFICFYPGGGGPHRARAAEPGAVDAARLPRQLRHHLPPLPRLGGALTTTGEKGRGGAGHS